MTAVGPIARAGLAYFALVFGAGFLLGMVRVPFLVPRLGERVAELVEMPVMFAVIWLAAGFLRRRHAGRIARRGWLVAGAIALALLLLAEALLVVVLQDRSFADYVTGRDPVSGSVYLAMLVVFALMPALRAPVQR